MYPKNNSFYAKKCRNQYDDEDLSCSSFGNISKEIL